MARKITKPPAIEKWRVWRELARRDPYEYLVKISRLCWIEDKTAPSGIAQFDPWEPQLDIFQQFLLYRLLVEVKARQLGQTWQALIFAAAFRMMFWPGFTVTAISQGDDEAVELVDTRLRTVMFPRLPKWLIQEDGKADKGWRGPTWKATKHELTIIHPDGQLPSRFKADAAAENSGRSFTANLILLDEWAFQQWAEEIWSAGFPTINRPGATVMDGQVIGISTGERGTLFERIAMSPEQYGFHRVFLPWWTDPRRDEAWYEATKRALPNSYRREYPSKLEDAFAVGQGAFFPEWSESHYENYAGWQPPKVWRRVAAYDPGYASRACFKWYAISPAGWSRCYREYYVTHTTDEAQAQAIIEMSKYPDGSQEVIEGVYSDSDAWVSSRGTGESTADVFTLAGLPMIQADKSLPQGWLRLHQWLSPLPEGFETFAMLTFTSDCAHTIRTYPGCKEARSNPEDIDRASEHHCFVAGTMVKTIDGAKPIEDLRIGDLVLTRQGYHPVTNHALTQENAKVVTVYFADGRTLTGTPDHPVFVAGKGFTTIWDLQDGDCAETLDGNSVEWQDINAVGTAAVYDITVDVAHEFYANGILSLNCQDVDRYFCMSRPLPSTAGVGFGAGDERGQNAVAKRQAQIDEDEEDDGEEESGYYGSV